jgi:hypothetical protein
MEYKVEVLMTPHFGETTRPYLWRVMSGSGRYGTHTVEVSGYSATPEDAWYEASTYYNTFIKE